ncbi:hypothetical protein MKQ70_01515 [Chitinophaga sedimenti]|uniref:MauE/DoxX family redox-associated membrane protein n=1 Tax=Chitinophaga sedimenti TaxID=2033606 RepID=UPI002003B68C|nr:MauE/DoxX family redox-associated membrane protein [Chitinophaga sedimenti]MCK7553748.1 hypothetical protein [Chitinophaga sedimenti]
MKKSIITEAICYFFFLLFTYTALSKWFIFPLFVDDLGRAPFTSQYPILFAITVPAMELIVAVLLLFNRTRLLGLTGALVLMLAFTIYVGYVLGMTTERPCSCGGIFRNMTWKNHMYFNSLSTVLAAVGLLIHAQKTSLISRSTPDSSGQFTS